MPTPGETSPNAPADANTATSTSNHTLQFTLRQVDITLLDETGSNFQVWKFHICTALDLFGYLNIVDGIEPQLALAEDKSNLTEVNDWIQQDKRAKAQISLSISDEPLNSIIYMTSAKEAYDKL